MYANPCYLDDYPGLGQIRTVTAYQVSRPTTSILDDPRFASRLAPPPPPPPVIAAPQPVAIAPPPPEVQTFAPDVVVNGLPVPEEFLIPDVEATVITVPGGGGGWGPDSPAAQLAFGPTEVSFVEGAEVEEVERGFGIATVLIAAGIAWVLSQSARRARR